MLIRTLERSDDRDGFACGDPSLDAFLARYAWQNQRRHHLGVTYVAVEEASRRVLGYFTIAAASLRGDSAESSKRGGYRELPALRIARLAVDRRVQKQGIGAALLGAALRIAADESARIGCAGVLVDANADAIGFYRRFGFEPVRLVVGGGALRPRPVPMFLSTAKIARAMEDR